MTNEALSAYLDELGGALELRDAPTALVADVLRQVESHTKDTGEDPYVSFGKPADYAKNFTPHARMTRFWLLMVSTVVLTLGGGWLLVNGIIGIASDRTMLWGLSPWYGVIGGGLTIIAWIAMMLLASGNRRRYTPTP
ncbi:hypothetical protein [Luethyella okanaganae]|uniref:DUF1707 domain-containing protein n=1 Tax=Luethyella okanaganae TaxID=69372 RepID=A0ABW1VI55_9MICO